MNRLSKRLAAMIMIVGLASCSGDAVEEAEAVRPAKLFTVKSTNDRLDVSFPAIIEARDSSTLTFQVSGLLESFPVSESQRVRKGQVLARLDQRRYRNALASAQAQFNNAQSEYQSAATLLKEDAIAGIVVQQRKAQRDVAAAALDDAKKNLADTVLRAPFTGIIAQKLAIRFENISPQQPIVELQTTGAAEAVVSVPASIVAQFWGSQQDAEAYVVLSSAPDRKIPGRFLSAQTQADADSQTFQVKFAFNPPPDVNVLPGMTATVFGGRELTKKQVKNPTYAVPIEAVLSDGKARYVWVVDRKTMKVAKRKVTVEKSVGAEIQISSGLKSGETVVSGGAAYLHAGMKIRAFK